MMEKPFLSGNAKLDEVPLRRIFLHHLNEVHGLLWELERGLPALADGTRYGDLQHVTEGLLREVKVQLGRTDAVFMLLKEVPLAHVPMLCLPAYGFMARPAQEAGGGEGVALQADLELVYFLQRAVAVKGSYFQLLKTVAGALGYVSAREQLQHCHSECRENVQLFGLVAKEYTETHISNFR